LRTRQTDRQDVHNRRPVLLFAQRAPRKLPSLICVLKLTKPYENVISYIKVSLAEKGWVWQETTGVLYKGAVRCNMNEEENTALFV
jgi:hypothetical protein